MIGAHMFDRSLEAIQQLSIQQLCLEYIWFEASCAGPDVQKWMIDKYYTVFLWIWYHHQYWFSSDLEIKEIAKPGEASPWCVSCNNFSADTSPTIAENLVRRFRHFRESRLSLRLFISNVQWFGRELKLKRWKQMQIPRMQLFWKPIWNILLFSPYWTF